MDWLIEPWTYPFMRWALVCCLVLGGIHAYLGFHVVRRGVLFVDLAMAQMAALGAAVGIVLGFAHDSSGEYLVSLACALAAAGLLSVLRSRLISQEAIIAIFYGLAMAATFVVLERSPHGMEEVKHLLVGQVLTVAPEKVLFTTLVYAVIGALHWWLHPRTTRITEGQKENGRIPLDFFFYGTFALVVTSSVGLVGVLLVFALLVMPAVAAIFVASGTGTRLLWGWIFTATGGFFGLHASFHLDQPAAPVIVLTFGAQLLGAVVIRRLRA
jgi:zinc/manganese transport system permease protein